MALFGKKKETQTPASDAGEARIKVLGAGCARCNALEAAVHAALDEMGRAESVGHVTDFKDIAAYGVMSTPALVVDQKVLSCGKVLTQDEVRALLEQALA